MNRAQRRAYLKAQRYKDKIDQKCDADLERRAQIIADEFNEDYFRQTSDDWYRCMAFAGIVYREITGSTSKTEKFLLRLNEVMVRDRCKSTAEVTAELYRATGIELEIQD